MEIEVIHYVMVEHIKVKYIKQMENYQNRLLKTKLIQITIIELMYSNMYCIEMEIVIGISLSLNNHQITHFMDDINGMEVKVYC